MGPRTSPVAGELFRQWQRARGGRTGPAARPFSRGWEELLEKAGLVTATERADAERDARELEAGGWAELKPVPYRPLRISRIAIPLGTEAQWGEAFGFVPPDDGEARRILEFPWEPAMTFVREARLNVPFAELLLLNGFIKRGAGEIVPIKERSLQIFGEEKRLDALAASALFRDGRLDARRDFLCEAIGVPLAWKRGPAAAAARPVIAIENAATWHSYCRWNMERSFFSAVVYGDGNRFAEGIRYLADLFGELGGPRRIFYFGDLDPQGLAIPQEASLRARSLGLPPVEPHLWSYRQMLRLGAAQPWDGDPPPPALCDWLAGCAEPARQVVSARCRLAQEHVGWEFLQGVADMSDDAPCGGQARWEICI
ncbi:MAG: Wadjet anti-phage system protein JetD domain-containing protein [Verrucomicrobiae bacterium]